VGDSGRGGGLGEPAPPPPLSAPSALSFAGGGAAASCTAAASAAAGVSTSPPLSDTIPLFCRHWLPGRTKGALAVRSRRSGGRKQQNSRTNESREEKYPLPPGGAKAVPCIWLQWHAQAIKPCSTQAHATSRQSAEAWLATGTKAQARCRRSLATLVLPPVPPPVSHEFIYK
jgi:hypothetical protein